MGKNYNFKTNRILMGTFGLFFAFIMLFLFNNIKMDAASNYNNSDDHNVIFVVKSNDVGSIELDRTITVGESVPSTDYVSELLDTRLYLQIPSDWINYPEYLYFQVNVSHSLADRLTETTNTSDYPINISSSNWLKFTEMSVDGSGDYNGNLGVLLEWDSTSWVSSGSLSGDDNILYDGLMYYISVRFKIAGMDEILCFYDEFTFSSNVGTITGRVMKGFDSSEAICSTSTSEYMDFIFSYNSGAGYENISSSDATIDDVEIYFGGSLIDSSYIVSKTENNGFVIRVRVNRNGTYKAVLTTTGLSTSGITSFEVESVINNVATCGSFDITYDSLYENIAIYMGIFGGTTIEHSGSDYKVVNYSSTGSPTGGEISFTLDESIGIDATLIYWSLSLNGTEIHTGTGYSYSKLLSTIASNGVGDYTLRATLGFNEIESDEIDINVINIVSVEFLKDTADYEYGVSRTFNSIICSNGSGCFKIDGIVNSSDKITNVNYTANGTVNAAISNAGVYKIIPTDVNNNYSSKDYFYVYIDSAKVNDFTFTINKASVIKYEGNAIDFMVAISGLKYKMALADGSSAAVNQQLVKTSEQYRNESIKNFVLGLSGITFKGSISPSGKECSYSNLDNVIGNLKASEVGTYVITLQVNSDNYIYTETETVSIDIADDGDYSVDFSCSQFYYDGNEKNASCKILFRDASDWNTVLFEDDITLENNKSAIEAGEYESNYTYAGNENFSSTNGTVTWNILPKNIYIKFVNGSAIYDGNNHSLIACDSLNGAGCFLISDKSDYSLLLDQSLRNMIDVKYSPTELIDQGEYSISIDGVYEKNSTTINENFHIAGKESGVFKVGFKKIYLDSEIYTGIDYTSGLIQILNLNIGNVDGTDCDTIVTGNLTIKKDGSVYETKTISIDSSGYSYSVVDAGTYTLSFLADSQFVDYFEDGVISYSFGNSVINKVALSYELASSNRIYSGVEIDFSNISNYFVSGLKSNDTIANVVYEGKVSLDEYQSNFKPKNVGSYTIKVNTFDMTNSVTGNNSLDNYNITYIEKNFEITKKSASITFISGEFPYTDSVIDLSERLCSLEIETGCFRLVDFIGTDINKVVYSITYFASGDTLGKSVTEIKEAGTYTILTSGDSYNNYVTTQGDPNYNVTISPATLTVGQLKVGLSFVNGEKVIIPEEIDAGTDINIGVCATESEKACIKIDLDSLDLTDDEKTTLISKIAPDVSFYINSRGDDYKFKSGQLNSAGTYTIIPFIDSENYGVSREISGQLTVSNPYVMFDYSYNSTLTYNGEKQVIASFKLITNDDRINTAKFTYSYKVNAETEVTIDSTDLTYYNYISKLNSGVYSITLNINNPDGVEGYDLIGASFNVEILKVEDANAYKLTCTSLVYNGGVQEPTCTAANGGAVTYKGKGQSLVGNYNETFLVAETANNPSKEVTGSWSITKADLTITFVDLTVPHTDNSYDLSGVSYYNIVGLLGEDAINSIGYSVKNVASGLDVDVNQLSAIGTYTITPNVLNGLNTNNYHISLEAGTFAIRMLDVSEIEITITPVESEKVYNGSAIKIAEVSVSPYDDNWGWDFVFEASIKGEDFNSYFKEKQNGLSCNTENCSFINNVVSLYATYAGEYTINVVLNESAANPRVDVSSDPIVIKQKDVEVSFKDYEYTYGDFKGNGVVSGVIVTGSPAGMCVNSGIACFEATGIVDDFNSLIFTATKDGSSIVGDNGVNLEVLTIIDAGSYVITPTSMSLSETQIGGMSNYNISFKEGHVVVNQTTIEKNDLLFSSKTCIYNGSPCLFGVPTLRTVLGDDVSAYVNLSVKKDGLNYPITGSEAPTSPNIQPNLINAGTYQISINVNHPNYIFEEQVVEVKINKATLDFTPTVLNADYTGTAQSLLTEAIFKFAGQDILVASLTEGIVNDDLSIKVCLVNGDNESCTNEFSKSANSAYQFIKNNMPTAINVGSYTLRLYVDDKSTSEFDNFETSTFTCNPIINKRLIQIQFTNSIMSYMVFSDPSKYPDLGDLARYTFSQEFIYGESPTSINWQLYSNQFKVTDYQTSDFSSLKAGNSYRVEIVGLIAPYTGLDYSTNYMFAYSSGTIEVSASNELEITKLEGKQNLVYNRSNQELINFETNITDGITTTFVYHYCDVLDCSGKKNVIETYSASSVVGKEAGYYYLDSVVVDGGVNYDDVTYEGETILITISKATYTITQANPYYISGGYTSPYNGMVQTIAFEGSVLEEIKYETLYYLCVDGNKDNCPLSNPVDALNTGVYYVVTTFEVDPNYNDIPSISTYFEITKINLPDDLTWESRYTSIVYDGQPHAMKLNKVYTSVGDLITITYEVSYNGGTKQSGNGGIDAGRYEVTAYAEAGSNYNSKVFGVPVVLDILPAPVILEMKDKTINYDGNKHFIVVENTNLDSVISLTYTIDGVTATTDNGVINAGDYDFAVAFNCSTGNYVLSEESDLEAVLTINQIEIGEAEDIEDFTYTGVKFEPVIFIEGCIVGVDYEINYYILNSAGEYESYTGDIINAGNYKIVITGVGNYTGETYIEFTIEKIAITIQFKSSTAIYDSSNSYSFANSSYYEVINGSFVEGQEPTSYNYKIETNNGTIYTNTSVSSVGNYLVYATSIADDGYPYADNYNIIWERGSFLIFASDSLSVSLIPHDGLIYTGEQLNLISGIITSYPLTNASVITYYYCEVVYGTDCEFNEEGKRDSYDEIAVTDAGTYKVKVVIDATGDNYTVVESSISVVVGKASYNMTSISNNFVDKTFAYSGIGYNVTLGTLPSGLNVTYVCNTTNCGDLTDGNVYSLVEVGTYNITANFTVDDNKNYEVPSSLSANFVITKANALITSSDVTSVYKSQGIKINATINNDEQVNSLSYSINGDTYSIDDLIVLDVGTHSVRVFANESAHYNYVEKIVELKVVKASLSIEWVNNSFIYDGNQKTLNYVIKSSNVEVTGLAVDHSGVWTATASGDYDAVLLVNDESDVNYNGNYETKNITKAWSIEKGTLSNISFDSNRNFVYDGTEKMVELIDNSGVSETTKVYIITNEKGENVDYAINVGKYKVSATISKDNYNSLTLDAITFEITPASLDFSGIKFEGKTVNYSKNSSHTLTINEEELLNIVGVGDNPIIEVSYKVMLGSEELNGLYVTNAGVYTFIASFDEKSGNYVDPSDMEAVLTINKVKLDIEIINEEGRCIYDSVGSKMTCTYDGEYFKINAKISDNDIDLVYSGTGYDQANGVASTGTYDVTISYENTNNYIGNEKLVTLVIAYAEFASGDIVFEHETVVYDGESYKDRFVVSGNAVDGANISYVYEKYVTDLELSSVEDVVNAGKYKVTATIEKIGYSTISVWANLTIEKADITVELKFNDDLVYSYKGQTNLISKLNFVSNASDDYEHQYVFDIVHTPYSGSVSSWNDITDLTSKVKDAGSYVITLKVLESDNYNSASIESSLVIKKAQIYFGVSFKTEEIVDEFGQTNNVIIDTFSYTGKEIQFLNKFEVYYDSSFEEKITSYAGWIEVSGISGTNVGSYDFVIVVNESNNYLAGNYPSGVTFKITQSSLTVTFNVKEDLVYNGNLQELATIDIYDENNEMLLDVAGITYVMHKKGGNTTSSDTGFFQTDAGVYTLEIQIPETASYSYTNVICDKLVTIAKATMSDEVIKVEAKPGLVYDGSNKDLVLITSSLNYEIKYTVCNNDSYVSNGNSCNETNTILTTDAVGKNADKYYVGYTITDLDGNYESSSGELNAYISPKKLNQAMLISNPANGSINKTYDGTSNVLDSVIFSFNANELAIGDSNDSLEIKVSASYEDKNVGTGKNINILSIEIGNSNYVLDDSTEVPLFQGNIIAKEVKLDVTVNNLYVGSTDEITFASCKVVSGLVVGEDSNLTCSVTAPVDRTNKGSFEVSYDVTFVDELNNNNYIFVKPIVMIEIGSLQIDISDLVITGNSKQYDKTNKVSSDFSINIKDGIITDGNEYVVKYDAFYIDVNVGNVQIVLNNIKLYVDDHGTETLATNYYIDIATCNVDGYILKREVDLSKFTVGGLKSKVYSGTDEVSYELSNTCLNSPYTICLQVNEDSGIIADDMSLFTDFDYILVDAYYDNINVNVGSDVRNIIFRSVSVKEGFLSWFTNYEFIGSISSVEASITPYQLKLEGNYYTTSGMEKIYDGTSETNDFKISINNIDSHELGLVYDSYYQDVNASNNVNIIVDITDYSDNYELVDSEYVPITSITIPNGVISKRKITIDVKAVDRPAEMGVISVELICNTYTGNVDGEELDVSCWNGQVSSDAAGLNKSVYFYDLEIDSTLTGNSDNYTFDKPVVTVNLTKTKLNLKTTGKSGLVYNGSELDLIEKVEFSLGESTDYSELDLDKGTYGNASYCYVIVGEADCVPSDSRKKINAGAYTLIVKLTGSPYYEDSVAEEVLVTIDKASFTTYLTVAQDVIYSGQPIALATITHGNYNSDLASIKYLRNGTAYNLVGDQFFATNAGTYDITVEISSNNDNYKSTIIEDTVVINKKTLNLEFVSSNDLVYTGRDLIGYDVCENNEDKYCLSVINLVSGESVTYYSLELTKDGSPVDSIIDAGIYNIEAINVMINGEESNNYNISYSGSSIINVSPKSVDIVIDKISKKIGTLDPEFTYSVTGLVGNDDSSAISLEISREVGENIGSYIISYVDGTFVSNNYILGNVTNGSLEVSAYPINLRIKYENRVGNAINPEINISNYQYHDDVDITTYIKTIIGSDYIGYYYNLDRENLLTADTLEDIEAYNPNVSNPTAYVSLVYKTSEYVRYIQMCSIDANDIESGYIDCYENKVEIKGEGNTRIEVKLPNWEYHLPDFDAETNIELVENDYIYSYTFTHDKDANKSDTDYILIKYKPIISVIKVQGHTCSADGDIREECYLGNPTLVNVYYGRKNLVVNAPYKPGYTVDVLDNSKIISLVNSDEMTVFIKYNPSLIDVYLKLVNFKTGEEINRYLYMDGKYSYGTNLVVTIPSVKDFILYGYLKGAGIEVIDKNAESINVNVTTNKSFIDVVLYYSPIIYPVIVLDGDATVSINLGTDYKDKGAYVIDDMGNKIYVTDVVWENDFNKNIVGTYYLLYNYVDMNGYPAATVKRTVIVVDNVRPEITLTKLTDRVVIGTVVDFNSYIESIQDNYDAMDKIVLEIDQGEFDTSKKGTYNIKFTVKDTSGNENSVVLEITVVAAKKTKSSLPIIPLVIGVFGLVGAGVGGAFLFKHLKKKKGDSFVEDDDDDYSAF
ncbi:MAG: DUF5011 domain-containing protein [Erysipelotrichaceae bacterium]|nr:DUF5011 domain-containing protein [Erysipelotrichaceae bacterium]